MNSKKWSVLVLALLALSLLLAACGASGSTGNFPTGKFIKEGETDYGMNFNANGTFTVFVKGDAVVVNGKYEADDSTFTETGNDVGCKSPMKFKYTFDGKNLIFNYAGNANDDLACSGRHADFNNVTYTLSK
jgi:major membrane immunogen (membrane-anchored lipoprotein)